MQQQINNSDYICVHKILHAYFTGLHTADIELLKNIFDECSQLQAPDLRKNRDQWLHEVANRKVPQDQGAPFDYQILAVEILGDQALAKVYCPLFEYKYIDFLCLLKEQGHWKIVNKMYSQQPLYSTQKRNQHAIC